MTDSEELWDNLYESVCEKSQKLNEFLGEMEGKASKEAGEKAVLALTTTVSDGLKERREWEAKVLNSRAETVREAAIFADNILSQIKILIEDASAEDPAKLNKKMTEALEFYASQPNWNRGTCLKSHIEEDQGKLARVALGRE